jgi:hypothetical protein
MSSNFRKQLKATSIKSLRSRIDKDNAMVGVQSNDYLQLEDGKAVKIRIFPAHPGIEDFYVPKKSYWISVTGKDGDQHRASVLDSRVHGGTAMDVIEEYIKAAKKKYQSNSDKLNILTGKDGLSPSYTWLCYAAICSDDDLKAKVWEFKKTVRDALNRLAMSEDEDQAIEVDPFTDPDEGLPVMVKFLKNPDKKKGENYYDVYFPKKVSARQLSDEEIEYFMTLKPLNELLPKYGIRDFEKALEGLQNFDSDNDFNLFEDEQWLAKVEEIKTQYDTDEDEPKKGKKKIAKKVEVEEPEVDEDEEPDSDDEVDESSKDEFDEMDRSELKRYIRDNELEISVKKSMSDDDIRDLIRESIKEDSDLDDEDDSEVDSDEEPDYSDEEESEVKSKSKITLEDIKKKLAGK